MLASVIMEAVSFTELERVGGPGYCCYCFGVGAYSRDSSYTVRPHEL